MPDKSKDPVPAEPAAEHAGAQTSDVDAAIRAVEAHHKKIIAGIILAVVVLGGILVATQIQGIKKEKAGKAFFAAKTVEELDSVAAEYDGTVAGGNALLRKAEILLSQEKEDDARIALLEFINKYPSHPRAVQGLYAMGNLQHNLGDLEQAGQYYDRALAKDPVSEIAPLIKIRQGDIAAAQGDKEKARQIYDAIPPSHPGTPFIDRVEEKIELLEMVDVPVVDAPPPAPPAPKKEAETPAATPAEPGKPAQPAKPSKPAEPATDTSSSSSPPAPAPEGSTPAVEAPDSPATPAPAAAPKKPAAPEPAPNDSATPAPETPKPSETPAPDKPAEPETPSPTPAGKPDGQ